MAQTAEQIMAELEGYYKPQKDIANAQLAALPSYYTAQEQGLGVAKDNAFRDILGAASSRGIAYSGMPIQEQTRYTGEKYLPALAGLKNEQNQRQFSLQDSLAKILQSQSGQAYDIRTGQLKNEEAARQAELDRQLKESQFQRELALSRAKSSGRGSSKAQQQSDFQQMAANLNGVRGRDGYVSPEDWRKAQSEWVGAGYKVSDFNSRFRNYANLTYGDSAFTNYGLK